MKDGISSGDQAVGVSRHLNLDHIDHSRFGVSPKSGYQAAKILAVDDNLVVAAILAITLKSSGHHVVSVFNGQQAIERLKSEKFDLVVLDLNLPDYSGFKVLEITRRHSLCTDTPIIIVSSSDEIHDISRARQLGAAGYFAKVVSPETLPDKIERILTGTDITWIDDYHCVTDVDAPPEHRLPIDGELWRAAFNTPERGAAERPPQTISGAVRSPRAIYQHGSASLR
jgi:CheY-like chemotaxis protein